MYFIGLGSSIEPNKFPLSQFNTWEWATRPEVKIFLTFVEFTGRFSKNNDKDFNIMEAGLLWNDILVHRVVLPKITQSAYEYIIKVRVPFYRIVPILHLIINRICGIPKICLE